jgi:spore coat protein U domain-containing protein, fimbrial subunit CupE1/2/3/6
MWGKESQMNKLFGLAFVLSTALLAAPARAGTSSGTMAVTTNVPNSCTVQLAEFTFSDYTGVALDGAGGIQVNCAAATKLLSIGLDLGQHGGGGARAMVDGAGHPLKYFLYQDAAHATFWGDTTPLTTSVEAGSSLIPVYGQISGGQATIPGAYSDTVQVTLNF